MSVSTPLTNSRPAASWVRWARLLFLALSGVMVVSIVAQVFFAGAGVLVDPAYWNTHRAFAHIIELVTMAIFVVGLFSRLPRRLLGAALLPFLLMSLQYVFLYAMPQLGLPSLRALHAVNALSLFWVSLYLWQATRKLQSGEES